MIIAVVLEGDGRRWLRPTPANSGWRTPISPCCRRSMGRGHAFKVVLISKCRRHGEAQPGCWWKPLLVIIARPRRGRTGGGGRGDVRRRAGGGGQDGKRPRSATIAALHDWIAAEFGGIDILVNSAGGQFPQAAIDFSTKGWNAVVDTSLNGTWYMMQEAARRWRDARRPGSISIVVVTASLRRGEVAARAGVFSWARRWRWWAPLDIRVNCALRAGRSRRRAGEVYKIPTSRPIRANPMMRTATTWEVGMRLSLGRQQPMSPARCSYRRRARLWGETWTIPRPAFFDGQVVGATSRR